MGHLGHKEASPVSHITTYIFAKRPSYWTLSVSAAVFFMHQIPLRDFQNIFYKVKCRLTFFSIGFDIFITERNEKQ